MRQLWSSAPEKLLWVKMAPRKVQPPATIFLKHVSSAVTPLRSQENKVASVKSEKHSSACTRFVSYILVPAKMALFRFRSEERRVGEERRWQCATADLK